ncbi:MULTISPECIES: ATP-binding protein [unclassified Variovorax]|jgi:nicotinamide riboside kinase|uniref:AAA family ATPase n=1 Tax=unclassified Variovorax TaxID=663243 RepID=UPI000F7F87D2|nr:MULTISPECIES: ATP-binding protein [unclassified Variovorax]RSZ33738.1 ATPase [Variovorax sp. 553]RSZ34266.1 ATPase [Variovorax sp. 679]
MTPVLPTGCVIALVGAESTGKTELARAIAQRLRDRDVPVTLVSEYLREWCEREGRTPRPDEQQAIADEQTRRIEVAAVSGVVVADTTALMTAVYSEQLFADTSLYDSALAAQRRYAITLLTALDLPWVADDMRDGPHARQPTDTLVRAALTSAKLSYAVVHGTGGERLANAWNAIVSIAGNEGRPRTRARSDAKPASWSWPCEKCSDPECEHKLFSDLIARRE